jgi:hypothetical protein
MSLCLLAPICTVYALCGLHRVICGVGETDDTDCGREGRVEQWTRFSFCVLHCSKLQCTTNSRTEFYVKRF